MSGGASQRALARGMGKPGSSERAWQAAQARRESAAAQTSPLAAENHEAWGAQGPAGELGSQPAWEPGCLGASPSLREAPRSSQKLPDSPRSSQKLPEPRRRVTKRKVSGFRVFYSLSLSMEPRVPETPFPEGGSLGLHWRPSRATRKRASRIYCFSAERRMTRGGWGRCTPRCQGIGFRV